MFSLQAAVNLRLAQGSVSQIRSDIKSGLGNLAVNIKANIDQKSISSLDRLAKNLSSVNNAVNELNLSSSRAERSISRLAAASGRLNVPTSLKSGVKDVKDLALQFDDASNKAEHFGRQVRLAGQRFLAFSIATAGLFAVTTGFKNALSEAIDFELQINKLKQVTDEGAGSVSELRDEILRLSTSLGVSSKELAKASVTITQAGIKAKDAKVALEAFAQALLAPNFDSAEQTVEGLIAIYQQFGKDVTKLKDQLGSVNAVAGAFAVEAGDLIKAVQKAGGAFSSAGGSLDELLALMTAVRSTTRESAEQIATGLRSIFTYVQRTETIDNLRNLGIELRYTAKEAEALGDVNLENQFVGPYQAILRLSKGLKDLRSSDPRYSQIIEDLGGVRQVSRVLPLIQQVTEAQKALNVARLGSASLEAAAAIRQDAIANKLTKVAEAYQKLANNLVDSKGFRELIDNFSRMAIEISKVLEVASPLIPVLGALAAVKIVGNASSFVAGSLTPTRYQSTTKKLATGGTVEGPGGVDKIPAMLTRGEYVVNARDTAKHLPLLQAINEGKDVQFLNKGGYVDRLKTARLKSPDVDEAFFRIYSEASGLLDDDRFNRLPNPDETIGNYIMKKLEDAIAEGKPLSKVKVSPRVLEKQLLSRVSRSNAANSTQYDNLGEGLSVFETVGSGSDILDIVEANETVAKLIEDKEPKPKTPKTKTPPKPKQPKTPKKPKAPPETTLVPIPTQPGAAFAGSVSSRRPPIFPSINPKVAPIEAGPGRFRLDNPGLIDARIEQINNDPNFAFPELIYSENVTRQNLRSTLANQSIFGPPTTPPSLPPANDSPLGPLPARNIRGAKSTGNAAKDDFKTIFRNQRIANKGSNADSVAAAASIIGQRNLSFNNLKIEDNESIRDFYARASAAGMDRSEILRQIKNRQNRNSARVASGNVPPPKRPPNGLSFLPPEDGDNIYGFNDNYRPPYIPQRNGNLNAYREPGYGVIPNADELPIPLQDSPEVNSFAQLQRMEAAANQRREGGPNTRGATYEDLLEVRQMMRNSGIGLEQEANIPGTLANSNINNAASSVNNKIIEDYQQSQLNAAYAKRRKPKFDPKNPEAYSSDPLERRQYLRSQGIGFKEEVDLGLNDLANQITQADKDIAKVASGSALVLPTDRKNVNRQKIKNLPKDSGVDKLAEFEKLKTNIQDFSIANQDLAEEIFGALQKGTINARQAQQLLNDAKKQRNIDLPNVTDPDLFERRAARERQEQRDANNRNTFSQEYVNSTFSNAEQYNRALAANSIGGSNVNGREIVGQRLADSAKGYGNLAFMAPEFMQELEARELNKAQGQLSSSIEAQVRALNKNIKADEARAIAAELSAQALRGQGDILIDSKGNLLGLTDLAGQLEGQGKAGDGRNKVSRFFNRLRGPNANGFGKIIGSLGSSIASNGGVGASIGFATAAPFLAQAIGPEKDAANKVATGARSDFGFRAQTAAAGVLSTAATGAAVGLAFGPWGAAIGAAAGAAYGLANSLSEASKQINEAKLANSLSALSDQFGPVAEKKRTFETINTSEALKNIAQARASVLEKAYKESDGEFLGFGLKEDSFKENIKRNNREGFGGQAQNISVILSEQLSKLASQNANASPAKFIEQFAANDLNKEFIRIIADVRNIPLKQALQELTKDFADAQQSFRVQKQIEQMKQEVERVTTSFARLSSAFSNAGLASRRSLEKNDVSSLAFNPGSVGVSSIEEAFNSLGSANGDEFNRAINILQQSLGKTNNLSESGKVADVLSKSLPSILSQLAGENINFDETLDVTIRKVLQDVLKNSGIDPNSAAANVGISSVVGGIKELDKKEKGNALKAIDSDASKLAEELLKPLVDPFKTEGIKMAKELAENANRFVSGLNQYNRNVDAINQSFNNSSELRLNAARANASVVSDKLGGGDPTRLLSIQELLAPFNERQSRLLQGTGLKNDDVDGIANLLSQRRGELEKAREARDNAIGNKDTFPQLAKNFEILNNSANNLQQALKNLAEPAQRAAAIQEKLNQLNQDQDSRLSYAERFINASPEERQRLNRGQILAKELSDDPNRFNNLTDDDKRLALEAARNIGSSQFGNGITGEGLRNLLLQQTGIVTPELQQQRLDLLNQQKNVANQAPNAQDAIGTILEKENNKFLDNLLKSQDIFFNRLEANLQKEEVVKQQQKISSNRVEAGKLVQETSDAQFLSKLGIDSQNKLDIARKQTGNIRNLTASENSQIKFSSEQISKDLSNANTSKIQKDYAQSTEFDKIFKRDEYLLKYYRAQVDSVGAASGLNEEDKSALSKRLVDFYKQADSAGQSQNVKYLKDLDRTVIEGFLEEVNNRKSPTKDIDKINESGVLKGQDVQKLNPADRDRLLNILDNSFNQSGRSLDNLTTRINTNQEAFDKLTAGINVLNAKIKEIESRVPVGIPAVTKAQGGPINPIFTPKGTDVVPAMLTPGEFVVNADAASKHADLLHHINSGTAYLAKGGLVDKVAGFDKYGNIGLGNSMKKLASKAEKRLGKYAGLDEAGKIKFDTIIANGMLRINKKRQLSSLLEQQAYAGTDDELAGSAISRLGVQEEERFKTFKNKVAFGFNSLKDRKAKIAREKMELAKAKERGKKDGFGKNTFNKAGIVGGVNPTNKFSLDGLNFDDAVKKVVEYNNDPTKFQQGFSGGFGGGTFNGAGIIKRASGGLIPGNGTSDSVLTSLTPGEFVLNRQTVKDIGINNLQKTNAGNSGSSSGSSSEKWVQQLATLSQALNSFSSPASSLVSGFGLFNNSVNQLTEALSKFPTNIDHTHRVTAEVVINGAEAFNGMEEKFKTMMINYVNNAISTSLERNFPDNPKKPTGDNVI